MMLSVICFYVGVLQFGAQIGLIQGGNVACRVSLESHTTVTSTASVLLAVIYVAMSVAVLYIYFVWSLAACISFPLRM